jgi:nitrate/nitrite transport system substrate-binding protein
MTMKKITIQSIIKATFKSVIVPVLLLLLTSAAPVRVSADKEVIRLGFIPLTDCAPIVMAKELGLFEKYGVKVEVSKETSWANVRDKILTGELDGAHCLFSMPFSAYTGVGGKEGSEMRIAMVLSNNGQAISLSKEFCGKVGFKQTSKIAGVVAAKLKTEKEVTFAMTFPGGTHDIWLRYWLAAANVNQKKVKIITIPPPQMVANMKVGNMDGYCVGEPWNGVAVKQEVGFTEIASQDIWKHHPEKALVVNKQFSETRKEDLKNVMKAVLEACKWLDNRANRKKAAGVISKYLNVNAEIIESRLMGDYNLGCDQGVEIYTDDYMLFHRGGETNLPRKSHAIWFMAQYMRFDYLKEAPDYKVIADKIIMQDLYKEVAASMKIKIPDDDMKPFTIDLDKAKFDPNAPGEYLKTVKSINQ